MPLTTIDQSMTTGLLKSSNNLSEINTKASREAAMDALSLETAMPVGVVLPYAGANPPAGWLLCNGQPLNITQYGELFTAISNTYGGDGITSFNVPDLRGRAVAGRDVQLSGVYANRLGTTHFGSNGQSLGQTGGSESNTLTSTEMPAHGHFVANTDVTSNDPVVTVTNSNTIVASNDNPHNESYILSASATAATVGLSSTTGSGGAHANVQPTMILNYIIKAKFEGRV
jgi:microcystin-dependent protein